jgi:hypothetical protein
MTSEIKRMYINRPPAQAELASIDVPEATGCEWVFTLSHDITGEIMGEIGTTTIRMSS